MEFFLFVCLLALAAYVLGKLSDVDHQVDALKLRLELTESTTRRLQNQWLSFKDAGPTTHKHASAPPSPTPSVLPATPPPTVLPPAPAPLPDEKAPVFVPPLHRETPARLPSAVVQGPRLAIDWEQFMGVKLFAWLGGFALFLGMAFFVKYSIDRGFITPLMRVSVGFLTGISTIIGGLWLQRKKEYAVTVQTLCAAGIAVLYTDIFASESFYHFLEPTAAFGLMALVTFTSFLLAVRLNSKYVAVLGLLGGFLTPPLLSTGEDHALALFSYIALLDLGV